MHEPASIETIQLQRQLLDGPLFVGASHLPGRTLDLLEPTPADQIKRYTDCYLRHRKVGNTAASYKFIGAVLPRELRSFVKCDEPGEKNREAVSSDALNALLAEQEDDEEEDLDAERSESDHEDGFEDLEDDDYNAEKYFNDGDEYGEGDEGNDEAAY